VTTTENKLFLKLATKDEMHSWILKFQISVALVLTHLVSNAQNKQLADNARDRGLAFPAEVGGGGAGAGAGAGGRAPVGGGGIPLPLGASLSRSNHGIGHPYGHGHSHKELLYSSGSGAGAEDLYGAMRRSEEMHPPRLDGRLLGTDSSSNNSPMMLSPLEGRSPMSSAPGSGPGGAGRGPGGYSLASKSSGENDFGGGGGGGGGAGGPGIAVSSAIRIGHPSSMTPPGPNGFAQDNGTHSAGKARRHSVGPAAAAAAAASHGGGMGMGMGGKEAGLAAAEGFANSRTASVDRMAASYKEDGDAMNLGEMLQRLSDSSDPRHEDCSDFGGRCSHGNDDDDKDDDSMGSSEMPRSEDDGEE
jgi:hypothetical protein